MKRKHKLPNKHEWTLILAGEAIAYPAAIELTRHTARVTKQEIHELWDSVMRVKYGLPPRPWEPADESAEGKPQKT